MAAKPLFPNEVLILGWENGGVSVLCKHCEAELGGGGCDCCPGNNVTLEDLLAAIQEPHDCEESE
jgi:hypothetical protein